MRILALLLWSAAALPAADQISGVVRDSAGAAIAGASVQILDARQNSVASATSGAKGDFEIAAIAPGDYVLVVRRHRMERRLSLRLASSNQSVEVILDAAPAPDSVTVTAVAGQIVGTDASPQSVAVITRDDIALRSKSVTSQIGAEEAGVDVQRTGPTMGGIFVRGLTAAKVNVFIDGVRYSTSAQRGGVNTFFNLIEASNLDSVEILRGPNSAMYGSDSLGGSIQFISESPALSGIEGFHGKASSYFNSADAGFGSNLSSSYSAGRFGLLANIAGRRTSRLRTGGGIDSRSALTRFLGLPSTVFYPGRMNDTAFTQYGGMLHHTWRLHGDSQFIGHYQRSQQDGGKRADQLLGGDGNLQAELRNLMLDFTYLRYDGRRLGWLDQLSATYSYNSQREERVNQGGNGNPRAAITHEPERTSVHGAQFSAARQLIPSLALAAGGDFYREHIAAPSYGYNPANGVFSVRRGRVPDGSLYHNGGAYLQSMANLAGGRLRLLGNLRFNRATYSSRAADSPLVNGQPLWPDDSLRDGSFAFRAGASVAVTPGVHLTGSVSRGFRAPHVTDLGTLGLTGSGFEVAAPDLAGMGATIGSTAGADAVSTGMPVVQVKPERSLTYEGSLRFVRSKVSGEATVFANRIHDNIAKQSLILPAGAVGKFLGSDRITSQNANGVVFVAASSSPVLARTNFDEARIYGVESRLEYRPAAHWFVGSAFTWLYARDERTGLAPNIEGGTPPMNGYLRLRYIPGNSRFWVEPVLHAVWRQDRLSSLDLSDRRVGAARTRSSIANFFNNGAVARGLVSGGVLLATRETLAQVQDRVLGVGVASSSLYTQLGGYVTLAIRAGFHIGERQDISIEAENLTDRNYRGISWGLDAPGRGLFLRYAVRF
jgi:hemoglobin/transferrin/lactoferrin receptor protein